MNPKEVLKYQAIFKLDLIEEKRGENKSEEQQSTLQSIIIFLNLREKIIILFRDYSFLLSEAKCKTKYGKYLNS